jgi:hypothetical protein
MENKTLLNDPVYDYDSLDPFSYTIALYLGNTLTFYATMKTLGKVYPRLTSELCSRFRSSGRLMIELNKAGVQITVHFMPYPDQLR